jgi:hypothetical protein
MRSIAALNLGHATRPKRLPSKVVSEIYSRGADTLILCEFVDERFCEETRVTLRGFGYEYVSVSGSCEYSPGRWHNQVLVASTFEIDSVVIHENGPDSLGKTNTLTFQIGGLTITGLRIPMYKTATEWHEYWDWIDAEICADIVIGDFNCDPERANRRDLRMMKFADRNSLRVTSGSSGPSYIGKNGTTSRVDHALTSGNIDILNAEYLTEGIVPEHTDHAALLVEFRKL